MKQERRRSHFKKISCQVIFSQIDHLLKLYKQQRDNIDYAPTEKASCRFPLDPVQALKLHEDCQGESGKGQDSNHIKANRQVMMQEDGKQLRNQVQNQGKDRTSLQNMQLTWGCNERIQSSTFDSYDQCFQIVRMRHMNYLTSRCNCKRAFRSFVFLCCSFASYK